MKKTRRYWIVYGLYGHRLRESFHHSWRVLHKDGSEVTVINNDLLNNGNTYSVIMVESDKRARAEELMWVQYDCGVFQNCNKQLPVEVDKVDLMCRYNEAHNLIEVSNEV